MQCATHPQVETYTRCSKCEKAICYRCLVETPVGHRCRDCAQMRKLPAFTLTPLQAMQAVGAAVGLSFGAGIAWALIDRIGFLFLLVVGAVGIGYVISEGVSIAANRKRTPALSVIAGISALVSFFIGNVLRYVFWTDAPFSFALDHAFYAPLWGVLSAILAIGVAVSRLRQ